MAITADQYYYVGPREGVLNGKTRPYYELLVAIIRQAKDDLVNAYYHDDENKIDTIEKELFYWYSDKTYFANLIIEKAQEEADMRIRSDLVSAYIKKREHSIKKYEAKLRYWFGNDCLADSVIELCRAEAEEASKKNTKEVPNERDDL